MAVPTVAEVKLMTFGYLTGADLLRFCPYQLLIKEYEVDNASLQQACTIAYAELMASLNTRYDVDLELSKSDVSRNIFCVKIVSILAVRNILGTAQNISEKMLSDFSWCDKTLISIRNGQMSLTINQKNVDSNGNITEPYANASLISSSYKTLG